MDEDERRPMPGPGAFQWNPGAWFGSQLGGTLWMLGASLSLSKSAPSAGIAWVIAFTAGNAVGLVLWSRRDRIRPYPALQGLLLTLGVAGLSGFASMELLAPEVFEGGNWSRGNWCALLVFPAMMAWFAMMERGSKRGRRGLSGGRPTP